MVKPKDMTGVTGYSRNRHRIILLVTPISVLLVGRNLEPTGLTTEQAVRQWRELEREYGLRDNAEQWINRAHASYNSHEQKDLRKVLLGTYGERWHAWTTDYHTGIEQVQDWWTPTDKNQPNPFRPSLYGRCRLIFVAPDGEYELAYNDRLSKHFVTSSKSERGFLTARKQYGAYHYPETELGKAVKKMRPVKEFDDIVDALRGYAVMWSVAPKPRTLEERIQHRIDKVMPQERIDEAKQYADERIAANYASNRIWQEQKLRDELTQAEDIPSLSDIIG